jgi:hypothetical protein
MPALSLRQEGHQFGASRRREDRRRLCERPGPGGGADPADTVVAALWELVEAERRRADASERRTDQLHHLIDRLALLRVASAPKAETPAPADADGPLSRVDGEPRPLDLPLEPPRPGGGWPAIRQMTFWEAAAFFAIVALVTVLVLTLV